MSSRVMICDTLLRDAHQSLLATRMRTDDMVDLARQMGAVSDALPAYAVKEVALREAGS